MSRGPHKFGKSCFTLYRVFILSFFVLPLSLFLFSCFNFFSLVFLCSLFFREILSYINSSTFLVQELFFRSSWFRFPFLSLRFRLTLILFVSFFFKNHILICFIALFFILIFYFYVTRSALSFSFYSCKKLRSLSLSFSFRPFSSLLISFSALTFFLLFSFLLFSHFSYWFFNCYIAKLTSLSCLLGGSVYFERVVITPATIPSLHCPLERRGQCAIPKRDAEGISGRR